MSVGCRCSPPAWVLSLFASVLLSSSFSITTLPGQYCYPPSSLNTSSEGGIGHALVFEHSFCWTKSLLCITGFETWWRRHSKSISPPQILRLPRGFSRGWWSQNTRLAFTCNLQGRSAAHFRKHLFKVLYYCVYRQFHLSNIIRQVYYLCLSKPIAVKVGLLKYVLIRCTVTERKRSRIT